MRTKTLWIKDEYLEDILSARKTVEVRVAYSNITRLEVGDFLVLNERYQFIIKRIGRYSSFADLLVSEDAAAIAPGMLHEELLSALRRLYPPEKEALGVVALEIMPAETQPASDARSNSDPSRPGLTGPVP